jgi:hypothetical protein
MLGFTHGLTWCFCRDEPYFRKTGDQERRGKNNRSTLQEAAAILIDFSRHFDFSTLQ